MIPIGDEPNDHEGTAIVTWALIAANVAVFAWTRLSSGGEEAYQALVDRWGLVPAAPTLSRFFTSMFLHANVVHLGGNMLYLWIFGDNVEARLGHAGYLAAYLATGLAGGLAHVLLGPGSAVPSLGASGAISGVLGMYLVAFPRNRVRMLVFLWFYVGVILVPAWLVLVAFFVLQNLFPALLAGGHVAGGGIAYGAHLGGFAGGALLFVLLLPVLRRSGGADAWRSGR